MMYLGLLSELFGFSVLRRDHRDLQAIVSNASCRSKHALQTKAPEDPNLLSYLRDKISVHLLGSPFADVDRSPIRRVLLTTT